MTFFDGAIHPLKSDFPVAHCGLAGFSASRHVPNMDSVMSGLSERPMMDFETWWNSAVIWDSQGRTFSRSDIVLVSADKDGGAHIDASLPEEYYDLTVDNSLGRLGGFGNQWKSLGSPVPACIRHIGHEVLVSLATHAPYAFRSKHHAHALRTGRLKAAVGPGDGIVISGFAVHGQPASADDALDTEEGERQ
ncbi:MAG: hypothetical protein QMC79_08450 [Anaerosomatales bacterium]|nr:hypothetical protein [Anaerosomatales bacterium]